MWPDRHTPRAQGCDARVCHHIQWQGRICVSVSSPRQLLPGMCYWATTPCVCNAYSEMSEQRVLWKQCVVGYEKSHKMGFFKLFFCCFQAVTTLRPSDSLGLLLHKSNVRNSSKPPIPNGELPNWGIKMVIFKHDRLACSPSPNRKRAWYGIPCECSRMMWESSHQSWSL